MALAIDVATGPAIDLETLVEGVAASGFDPRCDASFASLAPLLAGLARNRRFLADLATEELKRRCARQDAANGYGAQVFLLRGFADGFGLRANFWPAADDPVTRANGPEAFFYGHAHDHNFSFLTAGHLGPGYRSDDFERAADCPGRIAGDPVRLLPRGRSTLHEGAVRLYRRHRDIHRQLPPERFSVSLNILADLPETGWRDQFRFDIAAGRIAEPLATAPSQALLAAAVALDCGNARDVAHSFARRHPSPRMRLTAIDALAAGGDPAPCRAALSDPDRLVAEAARRRLAAWPD